MKKIMIVFLAAGLVMACNNNKAKTNQGSTNREQDDYNTRDNTDNRKPADNTSTTTDNNSNNDRPAENTSSGWPSAEINAFVTNCVSSASAKGMDRDIAQRYCNCMQVKMEQIYPDINDVAKLTDADLNSPSMESLMKDCLK